MLADKKGALRTRLALGLITTATKGNGTAIRELMGRLEGPITERQEIVHDVKENGALHASLNDALDRVYGDKPKKSETDSA